MTTESMVTSFCESRDNTLALMPQHNDKVIMTKHLQLRHNDVIEFRVSNSWQLIIFSNVLITVCMWQHLLFISLSYPITDCDFVYKFYDNLLPPTCNHLFRTFVTWTVVGILDTWSGKECWLAYDMKLDHRHSGMDWQDLHRGESAWTRPIEMEEVVMVVFKVSC